MGPMGGSRMVPSADTSPGSRCYFPTNMPASIDHDHCACKGHMHGRPCFKAHPLDHDQSWAARIAADPNKERKGLFTSQKSPAGHTTELSRDAGILVVEAEHVLP